MSPLPVERECGADELRHGSGEICCQLQDRIVGELMARTSSWRVVHEDYSFWPAGHGNHIPRDSAGTQRNDGVARLARHLIAPSGNKSNGSNTMRC